MMKLVDYASSINYDINSLVDKNYFLTL